MEKHLQLVDGHVDEFTDVPVGYFDIRGFYPEPASFALRAGGIAPVAGQDDAVLNFVSLAFEVAKKVVDAFEMCIAFPHQFLLGGRELAVGFVDRKVKLVGVAHQLVEPFLAFLSPPAGDSFFIQAERIIGNYFFGIDAQHAAVALAAGTSTVGIVVVEQLVRWLQKFHAIELKTIVKIHFFFLACLHITFSFTFRKCGQY